MQPQITGKRIRLLERPVRPDYSSYEKRLRPNAKSGLSESDHGFGGHCRASDDKDGPEVTWIAREIERRQQRDDYLDPFRELLESGRQPKRPESRDHRQSHEYEEQHGRSWNDEWSWTPEYDKPKDHDGQHGFGEANRYPGKIDFQQRSQRHRHQ